MSGDWISGEISADGEVEVCWKDTHRKKSSDMADMAVREELTHCRHCLFFATAAPVMPLMRRKRAELRRAQTRVKSHHPKISQ